MAAAKIEGSARLSVKDQIADASFAAAVKSQKKAKDRRFTAPTPPHLIKLGVPSTLGETRVPRIWFAMNGIRRSLHKGARKEAQLDKSAALRAYLPLAIARELPQHGRDRSLVGNGSATHSELAAAAGYKHRASYTRNFRRAAPWIHVTGQSLKRNVYTNALGERPEKSRNPQFKAEHYEWPSIDDVAATPKLKQYVSTAIERRLNGYGYTWSADWTHHKSTPGTPNQKAVLAFVGDNLGLFSMSAKGEIRGEIHCTHAMISEGTGLSKDVVADALRFYSDVFWAELAHCPDCVAPAGKRAFVERTDPKTGAVLVDRAGRKRRFLRKPAPACSRCKGSGRVEISRRGVGLLRVFAGSKDQQTGKVTPTRIVFVAARIFDRVRADIILRRIERTVNEWRYKGWSQLVLRVAGEVFEACIGQDVRFETIRRALRDRLAARGVTSSAIDELVKPPPNDSGGYS